MFPILPRFLMHFLCMFLSSCLLASPYFFLLVFKNIIILLLPPPPIYCLLSFPYLLSPPHYPQLPLLVYRKTDAQPSTDTMLKSSKTTLTSSLPCFILLKFLRK